MRNLTLTTRYIYTAVFYFVLTLHFSNAQSWQPVAGQIPGVKFTGIASGVSSPVIVAATVEAGIYRSIDSGNSWQNVLPIQDTIFSLTDIDGKHFCAGGNGFIYTSSDSGITWTTHTFPLSIPIGKIVVHPSGALLAATGSKWELSGIGKGVWLSTDTGITWTAINSGITKPDPLIEAIAVTPSGEILAGINDFNIGLSGRYGIMKLDSLNGSWKHVNLTVQAPFNQTYLDQNLRIESVFNINILDGQILTSIQGVYINFAYAFTIQKSVQDIDDSTVAWKVKWVIDSIPGTSSFYEHIINLFKDSHDTIWASISNAGNEINNNIFTGSLDTAAPWSMKMDFIAEETGRFLFSEGMEKIYAVSYFTGTQIFERSIASTTSVPGNAQSMRWQLFPNPAGDYIRLTSSKNPTAENFQITIFDLMGKKMMEESVSGKREIVIQLDDNLLPAGVYVLSIGKEKTSQILRLVKY